jgi:serine/threonine protein kinase
MPRKPKRTRKKALKGLERYVIGAEIGRGGMGVVYRARDVQENKDVALKELILPPDMPPERAADATERFKREADTVAALESAHIVRTFESFADGDRHFLVMEFVDGQTLDKLVGLGPLEPEVAVGVAEQVLDALTVADAAGVVHRDLKPENVFVMPDGTVKVGDFGVAQVEDADAKLTRAGQVLGTVGYMPPEQVRGSEVDGRSDIFAVGVMMYEMLIGTNPFHADQPTTVMYRISYEEPPALDAFIPGMPEHLTPVLVKAMAKDPDLRYQSAQEMLADLQSGVAPDIAAIEAAAAEREAERAKAAAASAPKPPSKLKLKINLSRNSLIALGVSVVILLAAGLGFLYMNNKRAEDRAAQRAAVIAEGKRVVPEIAEMKAFRAELDSVVVALKSKSNTSMAASARWDSQWQTAQDRYNARVDEVNNHNQQENQAEQNSIQTYTDMWGYSYTTGPTYSAHLWKMPSYPKKPGKLKVNLSPEISRLDALSRNINSLQSQLTSQAPAPTYMPAVYERIGDVLSTLKTLVAQVRRTAGTLVTRDSDKGQMITQTSANGIGVAPADDSLQKPDQELSLYLGNYGITLGDVSRNTTSTSAGQ